MKTICLILLFFLASCSKGVIEEEIPVSAFFHNNTLCSDDFAYMELDIDGSTYVLKPTYVEVGLTGKINLPVGVKNLTRAEVFDSQGKKIYHSKSWEDRGSLNGAIVVSLPYDVIDKITIQLFCS